jgi:hypothetical protein
MMTLYDKSGMTTRYYASMKCGEIDRLRLKRTERGAFPTHSPEGERKGLNE